jgi:hypothetical protein
VEIGNKEEKDRPGLEIDGGFGGLGIWDELDMEAVEDGDGGPHP